MADVWDRLKQKAANTPSLSELFLDSHRGGRFAVQSCGMYMDFSKQLIDDEILALLFCLAQQKGLSEAIIALMQGDKVNDTEARAALHTALRLPKGTPLVVDGVDVSIGIHQSLDKVATIAQRLRGKTWRGYSGHAITDVVNIGVGGSDLGPLMVSNALEEWADGDIRVHFVSNMDGTQLDKLLKVLKPHSTVFIISSKSFTTLDTLSNAKTALAWLLQAHKDKASILRRHFVGISTNADKMSDWGIHKDNQLLLWDWVGGRFSLWSAIGLAIAIKVGMGHFYELLAGAYEMDCHFKDADFAHNLPVILGLIGVWNASFLGINAHSVLPYDGRLAFFPNYLTQLEMESNGKSVGRDGTLLPFATCPILWGDIGSNAQHAFYQLLHQGTERVSCDFIAPICRYDRRQHKAKDLTDQHKWSLANCLAQSQVLAFGNQALSRNALDGNDLSHKDHLAKFKHYRGNQPSTTILLDSLSPKSLGALIALYEHKVYVMSVLWGINPFDQWGVEVGKVMAGAVYNAMGGKTMFDGSTNALLGQINDVQKGRL